MNPFHPSFLALSGDLKRTASAAAEFKVFYQKVPTGGGYTMDHSAISFAFDQTGRLRLALRHALTAEQVADDVRTLLHD
jgi:protein SCO1/2